MNDTSDKIPEKFLIMQTSPEDARGLQELLHRSHRGIWPNEKSGITPEAVEEHWEGLLSDDYIKMLAEYIAHPREGEAHSVAKQGNKILGACSVTRNSQDKDPVTGVPLNELLSLHVDPELKRRGVGQSLWKTGEQTLDPAKATCVWVQENNANAIKFYESQGFVLTTESKQIKLRTKAPLFRPMLKMVKKALVDKVQ